MVKSATDQEEDEKKYMSEAKILKKSKNEFIIRYHECFYEELNYSFCVVMEFCPVGQIIYLNISPLIDSHIVNYFKHINTIIKLKIQVSLTYIYISMCTLKKEW